MKTVIITGILFIIIIISIIFSASYTVLSTEELDTVMIQLSDTLEKENWAECEQIFEALNIKWSKSKKFLAILFEHNELEDIDTSLAYLNSYILLKDKNNAIPELNVLKLSILHLRRTDKIKLENLF